MLQPQFRAAILFNQSLEISDQAKFTLAYKKQNIIVPVTTGKTTFLLCLFLNMDVKYSQKTLLLGSFILILRLRVVWKNLHYNAQSFQYHCSKPAILSRPLKLVRIRKDTECPRVGPKRDLQCFADEHRIADALCRVSEAEVS